MTNQIDLSKNIPWLYIGAAKSWPGVKWTPQSLADLLGPEQEVEVRFGSYKCRHEAELQTELMSLAEFARRVTQDNSDGEEWMYLAYQRMHELLLADEDSLSDRVAKQRDNKDEDTDKSDEDDHLPRLDPTRAALVSAALPFESLGVDAKIHDITLWIGNEGAHSAEHRDAYGSNVVVQLSGSKRWLLRSPNSKSVRGSRLPFEESTLWGNQIEHMEDDQVEYNLRAGDVLVVPRHWWHDVWCESSPSISVNVWRDHELDASARTREALARILFERMVACDEPSHRLFGSIESRLMLNIGEECLTLEDNLELLGADVSRAQIADALLSDRVLDALAEELEERANKVQDS